MQGRDIAELLEHHLVQQKGQLHGVAASLLTHKAQ